MSLDVPKYIVSKMNSFMLNKQLLFWLKKHIMLKMGNEPDMELLPTI